MKQTNRWTAGIVGGAFFVITCLLIAASGGFTFEPVTANGTLTPTAWFYLPYISRCELPTTLPTSTLSPSPTPRPTSTSTPVPTVTNTPEPEERIVIDHRHVDASALPPAAVQAAQHLDVFFAHKSIGEDILEQVNSWHSLTIASGTSPSWFDSHDGILETMNFGGYTDPMAKIADFDSLVRGGLHQADVAMMKFCTSDTQKWSGVSAQTIWDEYHDVMASLQADFPDTVFVFWTFPLANDHPYWDLEQKQIFNDAVRAHCAATDAPLFDLADIVSDGGVCSDDGYEAACDKYMGTGGHFNTEGSHRLAGALWWLLARIAGWDGL